MATAVAVNNLPPTPVSAPSASFNLDTLTFSDALNYSFRTISGSLAQQTPDASQRQLRGRATLK